MILLNKASPITCGAHKLTVLQLENFTPDLRNRNLRNICRPNHPTHHHRDLRARQGRRRILGFPPLVAVHPLVVCQRLPSQRLIGDYVASTNMSSLSIINELDDETL